MFIASGGWPELENENDKRVSYIVSLSRYGQCWDSHVLKGS